MMHLQEDQGEDSLPGGPGGQRPGDPAACPAFCPRGACVTFSPQRATGWGGCQNGPRGAVTSSCVSAAIASLPQSGARARAWRKAGCRSAACSCPEATSQSRTLSIELRGSWGCFSGPSAQPLTVAIRDPSGEKAIASAEY